MRRGSPQERRVRKARHGVGGGRASAPARCGRGCFWCCVGATRGGGAQWPAVAWLGTGGVLLTPAPPSAVRRGASARLHPPKAGRGALRRAQCPRWRANLLRCVCGPRFLPSSRAACQADVEETAGTTGTEKQCGPLKARRRVSGNEGLSVKRAPFLPTGQQAHAEARFRTAEHVDTRGSRCVRNGNHAGAFLAYAPGSASGHWDTAATPRPSLTLARSSSSTAR